MIAASDSSQAEVKAILAWWHEAGVDYLYADEPRGWLKDEAADAPRSAIRRGAAAPAPPPPAPAFGDAGAWPRDLAGFHEWWLSAPEIDGGTVRERVAPRGEQGAALMVVVPEPEVGDPAAGALLSGPQGRLLNAVLAAIGLKPERVYFASVLARPTPGADWSALAGEGLGEVLGHHIALVAPKRLISFGRVVPSLLGHDPAKIAAFLPSVNQEAPSLPALFAPDLGIMAKRPGAKAAFWREWLAWSVSEAEASTG